MGSFSLHPQVQRDLRQILEYYRIEGGDKLADKFFVEEDKTIERIRSSPDHFHFIDSIHRRANFKTFPYHFIFEINLVGIRVTILRHHKRQPRYGMQRK